MSCRRAFEVDIAAVVHGDDGDADFRAHYPGCPSCAAEVQAWRELDATLRAGSPRPETHPESHVVLAYVDAPGTLAANERAEVERHLGTCRSCADEVRTLRRTDLGRLVADAAGAAARAAAPPRPARAIARVLWHPAFAYALVVLMLVPLLRDQLGRSGSPAESQTAESRPAESRKSAETRPEPAAADEPARAAAKPAPAGERAETGLALSDSAARDRAAEIPVLALGTGEPAIVSYATARQRGVVLRIPPPGTLAPGPVDVRVRSRAGGRELVTRVADRADAMVITIPRRWLTPGDYEVTLAPAAPASAEPAAPAPAARAPGAPAPPAAKDGAAPLVFTVAPPAGEDGRAKTPDRGLPVPTRPAKPLAP